MNALQSARKARAEFEQAARDLGADRAAQLLRDQPERFGELRAVEERRLLV